MEEYNYSASTFDADAHIAELNREISDYCKHNPIKNEADRMALMQLLLRRVTSAAARSACLLEGGPFAAILVDFHTKLPNVVGFGTNHVVPKSDPSAHAEVTAIRDACQRLKRTDLSGLTLIASCECCPMCLSAATGCKLEKIYFASTRQDAAHAGFSDENQYELMARGGLEQHALLSTDEARLSGHDAVVEVMADGIARHYYGDYVMVNPLDPTDLPSVQAIRAACRALGQFHLPEDTLLITRHSPHPFSLIVADWARIGRVRGPDPLDPAQDAAVKDTARMGYVTEVYEAMPVTDAQGMVSQVPVELIWQEIRKPSAIRLEGDHGGESAFEAWMALLASHDVPRY